MNQLLSTYARLSEPIY